MKIIIQLIIMGASLLTFNSCGDDASFVTEALAKKQITNDLEGKKWKISGFKELLKNEKGETVGTVFTPLEKSPLTEIVFRNGSLEFFGKFSGIFAYDVTSVSWGLEDFPDPHTLTVRTNVAHYFIMKLNHAYTAFSGEFKSKDDEKTYQIDFKRE